MVGRGGGGEGAGAGGLGAEYDFRRNVPLPCTNIYIGIRKKLYNSTSCLVCDYIPLFSIMEKISIKQ